MEIQEGYKFTDTGLAKVVLVDDEEFINCKDEDGNEYHYRILDGVCQDCGEVVE